MADVSTTIVSGPLCADAADCRLLGSAPLRRARWRPASRAGLRIGVVRDAVSEDVAPAVREACEEAIEALRERDRRRGARDRARRPRACGAGGGPDRQRRGPRRPHPAAAQPPRPGAEPDRPRPAQVPDAAAGRRRRQGAAGADADAPARSPPLFDRGRRDRLADRAGGRAAAGRRRWSSCPRARSPPTRPTCAAPASPTSPASPRSASRSASREGLPIGLQLQAAWGADELLLDAAEALERANGRRWVESLPPLARAPSTTEA